VDNKKLEKGTLKGSALAFSFITLFSVLGFALVFIGLAIGD
jgi:hypothetical protein